LPLHRSGSACPFGSRLHADFPSPADDYIEGKIDLNLYLAEHPAATFMVRVAGSFGKTQEVFS
jgi:SOS-response transcriptional repressor LexA